MKFFCSSFLPRMEIKKGKFLKTQLSRKASSVALKSFTNAHSPYWHSTFRHLTHTLSKLPGTNTIVTVTLSFVPFLTTCYLVLVHYCLVCIYPSPLCDTVWSSSSAIRLSAPTAQKRSHAALQLFFVASILLPPWQSVRAALPPAWARQSWGRPGWGRELAWEKVPCQRGARLKAGVQASLDTAASNVRQSRDGRSV